MHQNVGQADNADLTAYLNRVHDSLRAVVGEGPATAALEYGSRLVKKGLPPLFDVGHLAHVCGLTSDRLDAMIRDPDVEYTSFRVPKRGGGSRQIDAPSADLKHVQRWINANILEKLELHDAAHGFRRGRTIATNAQPHVGQSHILKFDIADFFGTTSVEHVRPTLESLGYEPQLTAALLRLTTRDASLPQGAPSSPALANAAAKRLDARLVGLARSRRLVYTRYADDLTFSGSRADEPSLRRLVIGIIEHAGYRPNPKKIALIPRSGQQRVTGLVVNGRSPSFPRDWRRSLRQEVHYLTRFGVEEHLDRRKYTRVNYREWLYGSLRAMMLTNADEAKELLAKLDAVAWPD